MAELYTENETESNPDIDVKNDIFNYKGYFVENEEDEEKKFYEFGAHFPYIYLCKRLEMIAEERKVEQMELEKKLKEKEAKEAKKEKESKEVKEEKKSQNTNENFKLKDNIKGIINIFESKGKSRNRIDVVNGLTYMPQMNRNKNNFNYIDNVEINLLKSTSGKNQSKANNNNINIKSKTNNKNSSNSNFSSKFRDNKSAFKKKNSENKIKKSQNQIKIRKRNNPNIININNSLHSNINIFNKKKYLINQIKKI